MTNLGEHVSIRFRDKKGQEIDSEYCMRDLNILSHAQLIELDVGSQCGGHGICGKDRVRCVSGNPREDFSAVTAHEKEHLNESDLALGQRLACQVYPERDGIDATFEIQPLIKHRT